MILVDTDVLVDVGRGVPEAIHCLEESEHHERLYISVITQMELIVGCQNKEELAGLDLFLHRFITLDIHTSTSKIAVDLLHTYRLSHGLLIADALIAATALDRQSAFISKNQRHYRFISNLQLLPYPQPFTP